MVLAQAEGTLRDHDEHAAVLHGQRSALDGLVGLVEVAVHGMGRDGHHHLVALARGRARTAGRLLRTRLARRCRPADRPTRNLCWCSLSSTNWMEKTLLAGYAERREPPRGPRARGCRSRTRLLRARLHRQPVVGPHGLVGRPARGRATCALPCSRRSSAAPRS